MKVEIWSDVVCPWCYVGKRNLEAALARFEHRDDIEVVWRAYELDPNAPVEREGTYAERIARKYGLEPAAARARLAAMTSTAADAGLAFNFDIARPGNTFDAHRLIHLAAERGIQDAVKERFLRATFTEGAAIGTRAELVRLAVEAGLDEAEVIAVLDGDAFAAEVRSDERTAQAYGVTGVPFFVIDETYGLAGAQPAEVIANLLQRAWDDTHKPALVMTDTDRSAACDIDGNGDDCAI